MSEVIDLDILRPEPVVVRLAGKEIDVSFIPVAITFDVDDIYDQLSKIKEEEVGKDPAKTAEAFNLTVKLCATFCQHYHPEMNEAWFQKNTTASQVKGFAEAIKKAMQNSMKGVEAYSKN